MINTFNRLRWALLLACAMLVTVIPALGDEHKVLVLPKLDLSPVESSQWGPKFAAHLMSRAGFGATPEEAARLAELSPAEAVHNLFKPEPSSAGQSNVIDFDHSGIFEAGLDPFPPSRPAATRLAKAQGYALGVQVKAGGNRPLQPVVNQFFYWLRASRLETDRVAYWWANRMLQTSQPLQEKMALFWHGHFATNEDKVRDYRKMLKQLRLFQSHGLGNFADLLLAVAQDPAMLVFLDAGVNVKDSPNENFAREIMELFSMGVGNYGEKDVQEAARAFTGWNVQQLEFVVNQTDHDDTSKHFLGKTGRFDGQQIIQLILQQPATSEYIASKLYRHFVNEDLSDVHAKQLGEKLSALDYDIAAYMQLLFLSKDFYQPRNIGSRIKGPVELMVSTYRKLGLQQAPGVPDFNVVSGALGQRLMHPPTVAGWSEGRSWITPSLLFERSNFVLDVLFPDVGFIPPDRYPGYTAEIVNVQKRLRQGQSISSATKPTGVANQEMMAASNLVADRDEEFNTRLGSMRGWQMALERVKPIPRHTARIDLTNWVLRMELATSKDIVKQMAAHFLSVELTPKHIQTLTDLLEAELGTADIQRAESYMEEPLRKVLHRLLSMPEYQLG